MRAALRIGHKYLALGLGALWLVQALSGMVLVFHREIDDAVLGASGRAVDFAAMDDALGRIERQMPGARVVEYFVSGGAEGQVDVLIEGAEDAPSLPSPGDRGRGRQVVRVDGASGDILRVNAWEEPRSEVGLFRLVLLVHKQLLAGRFGEWLIGLSGAFLIVTVVFGLKLAWPRAGQWRATLWPRRTNAGVAKFFGWHRALGLCLAPFVLVVALTGALMTWTNELPGADAKPLAPTTSHAIAASDGQRIAPSEAVAVARGLYPDASVAIVSMPSARRDWYSIRLRQPGELRRIYGTTLVRIDADTGAPVSTVDALKMSVSEKLFVALYPIHSGEWGGGATRVLALIVGASLVGTMSFGLLLWLARRSARRPDKTMERYSVSST